MLSCAPTTLADFQSFYFSGQGFYRLLQLNEFRDWLCKIRESGLAVDRATGHVSTCRVVADSSDDVSGVSSIGGGGSKSGDDDKRRLMQNMAQLWLQAEVRNSLLPELKASFC